MSGLLRIKRYLLAGIRGTHVNCLVLVMALTSTTAFAQRTATATPTVVNGFVIAITVTDGGSGYVEPPMVTITGGNGSGATATATLLNGAVDRVIVGSAGNGYTGTPVVLIAAPPSPKVPFSEGLVAYYPFIGNGFDESGNENNTLSMGVSFTGDRLGLSGQSAVFTTTQSFIECPTLSSLPYFPITYSVWFKLNKYPITTPQMAGSSMALIGRDRSGLPHTGILTLFTEFQTGKTNEIIYYTGINAVRTKYTPPLSKWVHAAVTQTPDNIVSIYIDGVMMASQTFPVPQNAVAPFRIGASADWAGSRFSWDGAIDDVRVYNRALSAQEVNDIYRYESPMQPSVSIKVETVRITLHVTPSKRYQLMSSFDLKSWANVGQPILAGSSEIPFTLNALAVGQFFRVYEVE